MPISATGRPRPTEPVTTRSRSVSTRSRPCQGSQTGAGFTLLEILVVMLIIGLTLALVQINLSPGENSLMKDEILRLEAVLNAAQDEVSAGGQALALEIQSGGYRFLRRQGDSWQQEDESPLGPHRFATGVRWGRLLHDGALMPQTPQRIIWRVGDNPPQLDLQLLTATLSERLLLDPLGRVQNVASEAQ